MFLHLKMKGYSLDIFKNTYHHELYRDQHYEMTFEVNDFFGPGFWSNQVTGVWGVGDQAISIQIFKNIHETKVNP